MEQDVTPKVEPTATRSRTRTLLLVIVACLGVCAGLPTGGLVLFLLHDPFATKPFDQSAWAEADPQQRAPMARDLIRRHLPVGLPAARVRELLGEPDKFPGMGDGVDIYGNRLTHAESWAYYLGNWSERDMDDAFLYVHFDRNGEVAAVEINGG